MKPILFNTGMVRALLEGRKTVTRRVVKPQPICHGPNVTFKPHANDFILSAEKNWVRCRVCGHCPEHSWDESNTSHHWIPPYRPSDILYVREAFSECAEGYAYRADYPHSEGWGWRPSIHMPREAARIFLRVTDVRVERLQEITEEQAVAEGFEAFHGELGYCEPAALGFNEAWEETIKQKDRPLYGWEANPWVWVITFERISKEEAG